MEKHVLIYLDDDRDDLHFFDRAVEQINGGIRRVLVDNPDRFFDLLKTENPANSIVFLDINLKGRSGFDVLKKMREDERMKQFRVVMYSTSDHSTSVSISQDLGADLYAVKPALFPSLVSLLGRIISIDWHAFDTEEKSFLMA